MALPPSIPTSFVPHPSGAPRKFRSDLTNTFGLFAYAVLGLVFVLAIGVFLYGQILNSSLASKDTKLEAATASIDQDTVEEFVRLRNRLNQGETLLNNHVAFSNFFTSLGKIVPANVRLTALHLAHDSSGAVKVDGAGVAKSFNALAVFSAAFAEDKGIRDAIFSKIGVNKDSSVSFSLSATLDPKSIAFVPSVGGTLPAGATQASSTSQTSVPATPQPL